MEREEILNKAQLENKGQDLADKATVKEGSWIAYIVAVILMLVVDTTNGFILHNVNRGLDFVIFTMAFVIFLVKYLKLRKRHELIATIIWGVLSLSMLAVWILQLAKVI